MFAQNDANERMFLLRMIKGRVRDPFRIMQMRARIITQNDEKSG